MAGSPGDSVFTQAQMDAKVAEFETDFYIEMPHMGMLEDNGLIKPHAGDRITVDYRTNAPDGTSYGRDSVLEATQKGERIRATYDWGTFALDNKEYGWDIENQGAVGQLSSGTLRKLPTERLNDLKAWMGRRLPIRMWQGAGAAYNGGDGVDFLGMENFMPASPSTATVGGLSWSTYDELQSQQISGAAGPSTDWEADAWERLLTLRYACRHPRSPDTPNTSGWVCYATPASCVDIINLAYVQNTNVGVEVKDIVSVGGIVVKLSDAIDANTVYLVNPDTWVVYYPQGRKGLVEMREISNFPDRMNKRDIVWSMTAKGCIICKFPPQNGVITSAG